MLIEESIYDVSVYMYVVRTCKDGKLMAEKKTDCANRLERGSTNIWTITCGRVTVLMKEFGVLL